MSTTRRAHRILITRRSRGQSIPLIALMIVILVAMVGLSVDVGNTFSQERQAVLAANAASLNAMNAVLNGNKKNTDVYDVIQQSFTANRVNAIHASQADSPDQIAWRAFYLGRDGTPLTGMPEVQREGTNVPGNAAFVEVVLEGRVDTYFARVVGTNSLPINASAYAGVCPIGEGIYPIGVNSLLINKQDGTFNTPPAPDRNGGGNTFDWDWRTITDPNSPYLGRTEMKIPLRHKFPGSTESGGNFGWLNWNGDGSAGATAERMWFPGNLSKGYTEVPRNQVPNPAPDYQPNGIFEVGDWIGGDNGISWGGNSSQGVNQALLDHIQRGTRMVLPIFDPNVVGNGANAKFRIVDIGLFLITGVENNGSDAHIKFVYLGDPTASQQACSYSGVPANPDRCCELGGNVSFVPQYQRQEGQRQPIRYVLVVDVSGSMSANFAGLCDRYNGNPLNPPVQCTVSTAPDGITLTNSQVTGTGSQYMWSNVAERRYDIARRSLLELVDVMNFKANTAVYKDAPYEDELALITFGGDVTVNDKIRFNTNGTYNMSGPEVFSRNPTGIKAAINAKITQQGRGTNGAAGLYAGYEVLRNAPERKDANGKPVQFRNVVIFVTDGISNAYFHPDANNYSIGTNQDRITFPLNSRCANAAQTPHMLETAECQLNDAGARDANADITRPFISKTVAGRTVLVSRPMTQMGEVSTEYLKALQSNGKPLAEVFVVALSGATRTGMARVVSNSMDTNFFLVRDGANLTDVFKDIYNKTANNTCPAVELPTAATVGSTEFISVGGLVYPNVGRVWISGTTYQGLSFNNGGVPALIKADPANGNRLFYRFAENVPPGEYTLTAELFYRFPEDVFTGVRRYNMFGESSGMQVTVSTSTPAGSLKPRTQADLNLTLGGSIPPICPVNP
ncbi:MAG: hypothetical protein AB4911_01350 [Oscillochloridaceae bacterium umkhey_bin13]